MLLIFLDTETTGLNPAKHRTLEIAFKIFNSASKKLESSFHSTLLQPQDVWNNADPKSLKINGFSADQNQELTEKNVAEKIIFNLNRLQLGATGGLFICQNPSFDRAFFTQLISVDLQNEYRWPYHWLDLASMYWSFRLIKEPTVSISKECDLSKNSIANYFHLEAEKEPHRAMNGVDHLIRCYEAMFGNFIH